MAYILHLETATKVCSVALSNNGKLIEVIETEEDGYTHAENLTVFVEQILSNAKLTPKDLAAVSVTSGPGSYTGLRIGVSTAKGLCYALGIPLIAVNALEAIAAQGHELHPTKNICALIDARRMEVFAGIYDIEMKELKAISADVIAEDTYSDFENLLICGDGAEKLQEIWKDRNLEFDVRIKSSAKGHVQKAFEKFQAEQFEDVAYFEPFYLKDFVALKSKKRV
ncbi:tRNA (adenosine(37)-N6)-threonylcarbamoyltransferase complex dimerization subunit type 1 TsaB [Lishizhenia sp.]|uniref:tRNA (adenosine(37)-N6)-threonylcarbamoyltransferase complex dimerization subunit type 1 TsaB n=1 Tax=Lishizhenia sp. TaxID=2497594 RepID=UPI00299E37BB|nr:tRNA (adenosine(37)-N6)-threonylcarbamoyltransferase complex dimerization subunit type 1 TsaB [Lishizhenia sp.]MDX1445237.1 tRNA (adenosine(37)-N6)-threonylcarbamoyltransferase complex dimerization subunit type 1 TsaB [Lishizhenia sp.]